MDGRSICADLTTLERSTGTPASNVMPAQTHNNTKSLLMSNILNVLIVPDVSTCKDTSFAAKSTILPQEKNKQKKQTQ